VENGALIFLSILIFQIWKSFHFRLETSTFNIYKISQIVSNFRYVDETIKFKVSKGYLLPTTLMPSVTDQS